MGSRILQGAGPVDIKVVVAEEGTLNSCLGRTVISGVAWQSFLALHAQNSRVLARKSPPKLVWALGNLAASQASACNPRKHIVSPRWTRGVMVTLVTNGSICDE